MPIDLCQDIKDSTLREEAVEMLGKPSLLFRLTGAQPIGPVNQKSTTLIIFLTLFLICFTIEVLFTFPHTDIMWIIVNLVSTAITLISLTVVCIMNPGYIPRQKNFMKMIMNIDNSQLCPDCEVVRTSRSRHCAICNRCTERFDHHCPWINNCVGLKNHNMFLFFLASTLTTLVIAFTQGIIILIRAFTHAYPLDYNDAYWF